VKYVSKYLPARAYIRYVPHMTEHGIYRNRMLVFREIRFKNVNTNTILFCLYFTISDIAGFMIL
jgi:hypothetical protein